jgi:hypothetical protein
MNNRQTTEAKKQDQKNELFHGGFPPNQKCIALLYYFPV